jgi:predicted Zn-dependent protease
MNLASALANLGRRQEAESVLERGVAAYPYNGTITARLAQQYAMDGQMVQARKLVEKYRKVFPEDELMKDVENHLDAAVDAH